jgi:hypothetical protein
MAQDSESRNESQNGSSNQPKNAITIFGKLDAPPTDVEPLTIDLAAIETTMEPPKPETIDQGSVAANESGARWQKFPLAASIALAALVGALGGTAATVTFLRSAPETMNAAALADETHALQEQIARLSGELAAFKAGVEAADRTAAQQLARIGERLDRAEKTQIEPAAKLTKMTESLDRLERRVASLPAPDVTGALTSVEKQQDKPAAVEGWKLRDYYAGRALLESRNGTLFEVGPGSMLPGVGKVETIKRVDGKVVVTTPKGIITSSLEPPRRPPYYLPRGY